MNKYQVHIHALVYKRWGFVLQKQFHVIGGDGYYYHLKWNDNDRKFNKLHDLGKYGNIIINNVIKISNDKLWIICNDDKSNFVIKEYSNGKNLWINQISLTQPLLRKQLGRPSLNSKLCCISVYNETLLIVCGNHGWDNNIHIIDIKKRTFRLSAIKLPSICSKMYVSSDRNKKRDKIFVYGYCREVEKENSDINIPYYLKETITYWMAIEFIQIICGQKGRISWGCNVDDILKFQEKYS